jgi:hypothetical protein
MEPNGISIDAQYSNRLKHQQAEAARQARLYWFLGRGRAVTVGIIVFVIVLTEKEGTRAPKALAMLPALLSVVLIVRWNRAALARRFALRAAGYYEHRIACLDGQWAGRGDAGARYLQADHPSALDLDLFGVGSLFELVCTARTRPGQDTLAAWLSAPAAIQEIRDRQAAVAELAPNLSLHEELIVLGAEIPDDGSLLQFAGHSRQDELPFGLLARVSLFIAPLCAVAGLIAKVSFAAPIAFVALALLPHAILALRLRRYADGVLEPALTARRSLLPLAAFLNRQQHEPYSSGRLRSISATLSARGKALQRLYRLLGFEFPAIMFGLRPQLALIIASWRAARGERYARWVQVAGELEALCSLANRARENPADVFPQIFEEAPRFEAEGLGHPLLPRDRCVLNDVSLSKEKSLLLVSGSNMSGKSTFLRTVGINAVLALAGAPVRAVQLRISPLVIGATLRVQDSLREGRSRFYAEALRIRQLLVMAEGSIPLLFLLDEMLQGTNSRDRRTAAESILRGLVERGAIGLVTTHDLALTEIVDLLLPRAANVHFADQLSESGLAFDYRLKEGVVPASNALALLRAIGIEV